jgi:hypothetical protein
LIKDHVLLKKAGLLKEADAQMKARIDIGQIAELVELIPDAWLADDPGFDGKSAQRQAYLSFFKTRLASSSIFVEEAIHARAAHV